MLKLFLYCQCDQCARVEQSIIVVRPPGKLDVQLPMQWDYRESLLVDEPKLLCRFCMRGVHACPTCDGDGYVFEDDDGHPATRGLDQRRACYLCGGSGEAPSSEP